MWPVLIRVLSRFGGNVTLPFICVIGFLGYQIEGRISDRYTPATAPVTQQREERLLANMDTPTGNKKHNPLEVNLSPSLSA